MRKLIFVFLFTIPFCKAAANGPKDSWENKDKEKAEDFSSWDTAAQKYMIYVLEEQKTEDFLCGQTPCFWELSELYGMELNNKQITAISDNLNFPLLNYLNLNDNHIQYVNPQILNQLPQLERLDLNKNPLTPENVAALRQRAATIAAETGRIITIIADDIGEQYLPAGISVKGAKR